MAEKQWITIPLASPPKSNERFVLSAETSIDELITLYPEAKEILAKYGLHCVGCSFRGEDTLRQGVAAHGFPVEPLLEELQRELVKWGPRARPAGPAAPAPQAHPKRAHSPIEPGVKLLDNLRNVQHIIVVMSGKGGVGKSTVATNLAFALAARGHVVGLLDADLHGPSVPKLLGLEDATLSYVQDAILPVMVAPNLKMISIALLLGDRDSPVVWRGPMKMQAIRQFLEDVAWGALDYLIIDLPPGTGDEPLTIAQLVPQADGAIIVTTPQDVALVSVRKSITFAKMLKFQILGVIENMSGLTCPHCAQQIPLFKVGGGERICQELGIPFLGRVPLDETIPETGDLGIPFVLENRDRPAAKAFDAIVERVEQGLEESVPGTRIQAAALANDRQPHA